MYKQKKLGARILSFALSAAMVFTMFPAIVFAAEGEVPPGASDTPTTITETTQETIPVTWQDDREYTPAPRSGSAAPTKGETYYFDMSGEAGNIGTINEGGNAAGGINPVYAYFGVPDTSLRYVPFTYVGTISAYSLSHAGDSNTTSSNRTLFVADYNIITNVSWDILNSKNLIFGKDFDGKNYTLRSLSVGNNKGGVPTNNEWSQILSKLESYIKNWKWLYSCGQETYVNNKTNCALRGYNDNDNRWGADNKGITRGITGFRPALEVKTPSNLKAVTLDLNGGSFDSNGSGVAEGVVNSLNIVCAGDTFTAPSETSLTRPSDKAGNYFKWSTEQKGGTLYDAGTSVPNSVTTLYAQWEELVPAITVGTQTGAATYGTGATPTYAVTASNFGGNYPEFAPQVAWTDGNAPTGVTPTFSGTNNEKLTMTTTTATPAGDYQFKVVSPKASPDTSKYESATATLKVGKRTATITWVETSFTYNGNPQSPTATVGNKIGSDEVTV